MRLCGVQRAGRYVEVVSVEGPTVGRQLLLAVPLLAGPTALVTGLNGLMLTAYQDESSLCEGSADDYVAYSRCLSRVAGQNWFEQRPGVWSLAALSALVFVLSVAVLIGSRRRRPIPT
ncbi:MAG: hypothetical protein ACT4QG_15935 [Sporichthyaceae bacterium]